MCDKPKRGDARKIRLTSGVATSAPGGQTPGLPAIPSGSAVAHHIINVKHFRTRDAERGRRADGLAFRANLTVFFDPQRNSGEQGPR